MTTQTGSDGADTMAGTVEEQMRGTRNLFSVKRVFGESYYAEGKTIIPVASIAGGAGGGAGEDAGDDESGRGFGSGYGIRATPVGVYEISEGSVEWKPAVDVNRMIRGGQVLTAIIAICLTLVVLSRSR